MPTTNCRTVPRTPCPRCGGLWWHVAAVADLYHSCLWCGYVPERVHRDPALLAELIEERRRERPEHHHDALQRRYAMFCDTIDTDRDLAELRAVDA